MFSSSSVSLWLPNFVRDQSWARVNYNIQQNRMNRWQGGPEMNLWEAFDWIWWLYQNRNHTELSTCPHWWKMAVLQCVVIEESRIMWRRWCRESPKRWFRVSILLWAPFQSATAVPSLTTLSSIYFIHLNCAGEWRSVRRRSSICI